MVHKMILDDRRAKKYEVETVDISEERVWYILPEESSMRKFFERCVSHLFTADKKQNRKQFPSKVVAILKE